MGCCHANMARADSLGLAWWTCVLRRIKISFSARDHAIKALRKTVATGCASSSVIFHSVSYGTARRVASLSRRGDTIHAGSIVKWFIGHADEACQNCLAFSDEVEMSEAESNDGPIDLSTLGEPGMGDHPYTRCFTDVLKGEFAAINKRRILLDTRRKVPRGLVKRMCANPSDHGLTGHTYDTTGVALSGGGIRSAAFCLGALQALAVNDAVEGIDYLSTVSGGGYIGSSLTAAMQVNDGKFPFAEGREWADLPAVRHIRDYSNYLRPKGVGDLITALCIIGRGLVVNAIFVLPLLLLWACLTIVIYPNLTYLVGFDSEELLIAPPIPHLLLEPVIGFRISRGFSLTGIALALNIIFLTIWAGWRSFQIVSAKRDESAVAAKDSNSVELTGGFARIAKVLFILTFVIAFCDLQPFVLLAMFNGVVSPITQRIHEWTTWATPMLAPFAGVTAFFSRRIGEALKTTSRETGPTAMIGRIAGRAAILFAAIVLPSFIWMTYLEMTYFGIASDAANMNFHHAPAWLRAAAGWLNLSIWSLYSLAGLFLLIVGLFIGPNSTSLHQLYRDRLSKAFLFNPAKRNGQPVETHPGGPELGDLDPAGGLRLHTIDPSLSPYHIINAALNLEGSRASNRRGRNADFFIFSSEFSGSDPVGFIGTRKIEEADPALDLGTAMAISGAAVSSNMGAETIKPWAITLTLLNLRLGYWLKNPLKLNEQSQWQGRELERKVHRATQWMSDRFIRPYLFREMFGRLNESDSRIYLTDGGHIENLGMYALLKRRCQLIIVVDAEADRAMNFGALVILQRYARIDLGVRIDLPWRQVRECALDVDREIRANTGKGEPLEQGFKERSGPHCAIGSIAYPDGAEGMLLYVKASLSGDENDYILDYKRRNTDFPHETTADQFFTEEQFEVYRALGFHVLDGVFKGKCEVPGASETVTQSFNNLGNIDRFRVALGLPPLGRRQI
jgi:hypothetical protein